MPEEPVDSDASKLLESLSINKQGDSAPIKDEKPVVESENKVSDEQNSEPTKEPTLRCTPSNLLKNLDYLPNY